MPFSLLIPPITEPTIRLSKSRNCYVTPGSICVPASMLYGSIYLRTCLYITFVAEAGVFVPCKCVGCLPEFSRETTAFSTTKTNNNLGCMTELGTTPVIRVNHSGICR